MKQRMYTVQLVDGRAWARLSSTQVSGIARIHEVLRITVLAPGGLTHAAYAPHR